MSETQNHIKRISKTVEDWLKPDNFELMQAIDQTVNEGLFSFEDIKFQILSLKKSLREENLQRWARISGLKAGSIAGKRILCLHAGNLPLVGFQDLLSVIMTGGSYLGKLSKKDPYLLPTLLQSFQKHGIADDAKWAADLDGFSGLKSDAVLFAGSKQSAISVEKKLGSLKLADQSTPKLMRTAHFSIAWIHDNNKKTMEDLTEAVFRYGGAGCRSVAIVVAPFHLNSQKCSFTDYVEAFWLKNPQHQNPPESLFHRFAFNKAAGIEQAWLNDFLIEENLEKPEHKFILHWINGGEQTLKEIINSFRDGLQSVYSTGEMVGKEIGGFITEPLSEAQSPPIWWKPDGVDTIQWLQQKLS